MTQKKQDERIAAETSRVISEMLREAFKKPKERKR